MSMFDRRVHRRFCGLAGRAMRQVGAPVAMADGMGEVLGSVQPGSHVVQRDHRRTATGGFVHSAFSMECPIALSR